MSPPTVWGPVVWRLFHTLAENINENGYTYIYKALFFQIQRICKFLPCPECSKDASIFLAKIKLEDLKTKTDFINIFYLFHNYVNAKKRQPLFNYANINTYKNYRLINVINSFIIHYNTKGNMKLIAESFQRQLIVKDFKAWLRNYYHFFIPTQLPIQNPIQEPILEDEVVEEPVVEQIELEEKEIEEPVVEQIEVEEKEKEKEKEEPILEVVEEPVVEEKEITICEI